MPDTRYSAKCGVCAYNKGKKANGDHECHRNPPQLIMVTGAPDVRYMAHWPKVKEEDWCGEYWPASRTLRFH